MVNAWLAFYTAGLAAGVRQDRRDEVRSDLWEHRDDAERHGRPVGSIEAEIALRCLRGMGADVAWRRRQQHARPLPARVAIGMGWTVAALGCALLVVVPAGIVAGYAISPAMRSDPHWIPFLLTGTAIVAVQVFGMALAVRRRRLGLTVVGVGLWSVVAAMTWAWPIVVPAAVASSGGLFRLARRRPAAG